MTWTQFWDMHSGGGTKEPPYEKIYIEAPEDEAKRVFYSRFGHDSGRVSCTCCGDDYSVSEGPTLDQLTAFHRNCTTGYFYKDTGERVLKKSGVPRDEMIGTYDRERGCLIDPLTDREVEQLWIEEPDNRYGRQELRTIEDYVTDEDVLVIYEHEITDAERQASVPMSGWVWTGE